MQSQLLKLLTLAQSVGLNQLGKLTTILALSLLSLSTRAIAQPIPVPAAIPPIGEAQEIPPPPTNPNPSPSDEDDADEGDEESGDEDTGDDGDDGDDGSGEEESQENTEGISEESLPANPLNDLGGDLNRLIEKGINDDLWAQAVEGLPCVGATADCLKQLQSMASTNNALVREIDARIEEAQERIEEAKSRNTLSIKMSVLTPALQAVINYQPAAQVNQQGQQQPTKQRSVLRNIFDLVTNPLGGVGDAAIRAVALPLLQGVTGTNSESQQRAIALS